MTRKAYSKTTGNEIVSTLETLRATCAIVSFDEHGEPGYDGFTEIDWDSQETGQRDGQRVFLDANGNEVVELGIEFRDDSDEGESE